VRQWVEFGWWRSGRRSAPVSATRGNRLFAVLSALGSFLGSQSRLGGHQALQAFQLFRQDPQGLNRRLDRPGLDFGLPGNSLYASLLDSKAARGETTCMLQFSTEFPINAFTDKAQFVAEMVSWLRGTQYSTVLDHEAAHENDGARTYRFAPSGEELRTIEFDSNGSWAALGFRHDYPDDLGRDWRTECVVKRLSEAEAILRIRSQCSARSPTAKIDVPKRPFLVKAILTGGRGSADGLFQVTDKPIWLEETETHVSLASSIVAGIASKYLPILYVSATNSDNWLLSRDQIEKLAYDVGGVAHVVVEPSRAFSFELMGTSKGQNPYGGTVGVASPQAGLVQRLFLGWDYPSSAAISEAAKRSAISLRGRMSPAGWDWTELQEAAISQERNLAKQASSSIDLEKLYNEEIYTLKEQITDLKKQIQAQERGEEIEKLARYENKFSKIQDLFPSNHKELYDGELEDRFRLALNGALRTAEASGLDSRSTAVFKEIASKMRLSSGCEALLGSLDKASKAGAPKSVKQFVAVLEQMGFVQKSQNNHIRMEPPGWMSGVESITLPKTPSDHRAALNIKAQIEKTLGINKL
jgi:hypothetical protein